MSRVLCFAAVLLVALVPAAEAATPTRAVSARVTVKNATSAPLSSFALRVRLAKGTRLSTTSSTLKADKRSGTLTLTSKRSLAAGASRTLAVRVTGRHAPTRWTFSSRTCSVRKAKRKGTTARIAVSCTTQGSAPTGSTGSGNGGSAGGSGGGTTPATPTTPTTPAAPATPPSPSAWFRFAPFADMAGYPPPDLAAARKAGVPHVTLGFVTAQQTTKCIPTWGGYKEYPASGSSAYQLAQVNADRAAGGDVVVSFGGAAGAELATVCTSVAALTSAYQQVIDTYGATRIDFDVEGAAITKTTANTRRAQAIAALQKAAASAKRSLAVGYTLPVVPTGLDADGVAVLKNAVANGVTIAQVNVMAMDYGDDAAPSPSGKMGRYAIQAGTATAGQLDTILPGGAGFAHLGVTPMIGVNDVQSEVTSLADAKQIAAWASQKHISSLAMWSLGRDRQCASPQTSAQTDCSSVSQSPWAFSAALSAFTG